MAMARASPRTKMSPQIRIGGTRQIDNCADQRRRAAKNRGATGPRLSGYGSVTLASGGLDLVWIALIERALLTSSPHIPRPSCGSCYARDQRQTTWSGW